MKTELPEPDEYYRPTRVRELRREAARLGRWVLNLVALGSALFLVPTWLLLEVGTPGFPKALPPWLLLCGLLGAIGAGGAAVIVYTRIDPCRREAARLEEEHAARYGSLKEEQDPGRLRRSTD